MVCRNGWQNGNHHPNESPIAGLGAGFSRCWDRWALLRVSCERKLDKLPETMTPQSFAIVLVRAFGLWLILAGILAFLDALFVHWHMAGLAPSSGWTSYPPLAPSPSQASTVETFFHDTYYVVSRTAGSFGGIASRIVIGLALIIAGAPIGRLLAPRDTESTSK
jgi:hypothetical protein